MVFVFVNQDFWGFLMKTWHRNMAQVFSGLKKKKRSIFPYFPFVPTNEPKIQPFTDDEIDVYCEYSRAS